MIRKPGAASTTPLRLHAARRLGLREIPVRPCEEWCRAQARFRLTVNDRGPQGRANYFFEEP